MSSRAMLLCLLLTCAQPLHAANWVTFAAASTRAEDPLLIQVLRESDFQERVDICSALAARKDVFISDVIESVIQERTSGPRGGVSLGSEASAGAELLVRILVAPMADTSQPSDLRRARLAANQPALDLLLDRLETLEDPQLVAELVRMAPLMEPAGARRLLGRVASMTIGRLRASGGHPDARDTALLLDWVSIAAVVRGRDLLEPLVEISALTRDKAVVGAAREAARTVASE